MGIKSQLSLLGKLAIREIRDEAERDRHFIDDDVPNPPDCPLSNPQSRRRAVNV